MTTDDRIAELEAALRIYADPANWKCPRCGGRDSLNCYMGRWSGPTEPAEGVNDGQGYDVAAKALAAGTNSATTTTGRGDRTIASGAVSSWLATAATDSQSVSLSTKFSHLQSPPTAYERIAELERRIALLEDLIRPMATITDPEYDARRRDEAEGQTATRGGAA